MVHLTKDLSSILFIVISLLFMSCENDMQEVARVIKKNELTREKAENVEILYSDSAQVRVRIQSDVLYNYLDRENPKMEFPDGLKVEFFNGNAQPSSELFAKYAVREEKKEVEIIDKNGKKSKTRKPIVTVRDSVVIHGRGGEKLETEELTWDETTKEIYSKKLVKITSKDDVIYGRGFHANQDFTRWTLDSQVVGRIKADDLTKNIQR